MTDDRSGRPWPGSVQARLQFERAARRLHPSLRGRAGRGRNRGGFSYTVTLDLVFFEARRVTVFFRAWPLTPAVYVDGPSASPHRYSDRSLCMWHPGDSSAWRWRFQDGLVDLLDTVRAHLLREAIWRETGDWPGEEAPHGTEWADEKEAA